jgi:hypothetical protein
MLPSAREIDSETTSVDLASSIRALERKSPELIALARDWENVMVDLARVEEKMKTCGQASLGTNVVGLMLLI